jgi:hypothetical protein
MARRPAHAYTVAYRAHTHADAHWPTATYGHAHGDSYAHRHACTNQYVYTHLDGHAHPPPDHCQRRF